MMKNVIRTISVIIATIFPAVAMAAIWNIDPEHSNIGFKVKHLMVSNVKGNFNKHTGVVEIDDKDITKSKVTVSIDTNSINTNIQKRDEHLRSADFFDVANYPAMTFVSKKVAKSSKGALKVTGDLTIHGITKTVILNVEPLSAEIKDPWGSIRRGASASAKISRKDFGLTWNKALETGGVLIGDEITINLDVEMIKEPAK